MRIIVARSPKELGEEAARLAAEALCGAVRKKGWARMALATGASQLETLSALSRAKIPWQQVELFQVCEHAGLEENDPGSCRRALRERFAKKVALAKAHYLDGTEENARVISREIRRAPLDVLLLGIGDQGQIGFNAAPADFETDDAYVRIGETITMTVQQMMCAAKIVACAPYGLHAENVYEIMTHRLTESLPATALKLHGDFDLLLDRDSAAKIGVELAARYNPELEMYRIMGSDQTEE